VFRRGDERALIDIVRTETYFVVHVREPNGERWMIVATALDAILEQADVERALTWEGWYLADLLRSGCPGQIRSPARCGVGSGDGVPLTGLPVPHE
jgi:hypothetical protein